MLVSSLAFAAATSASENAFFSWSILNNLLTSSSSLVIMTACLLASKNEGTSTCPSFIGTLTIFPDAMLTLAIINVLLNLSVHNYYRIVIKQNIYKLAGICGFQWQIIHSWFRKDICRKHFKFLINLEFKFKKARILSLQQSCRKLYLLTSQVC